MAYSVPLHEKNLVLFVPRGERKRSGSRLESLVKDLTSLKGMNTPL